MYCYYYWYNNIIWNLSIARARRYFAPIIRFFFMSIYYKIYLTGQSSAVRRTQLVLSIYHVIRYNNIRWKYWPADRPGDYICVPTYIISYNLYTLLTLIILLYLYNNRRDDYIYTRCSRSHYSYVYYVRYNLTIIITNGQCHIILYV